jgi:phosphatidylserine/phosphatidylglycerophosphate/cardiolipin synthase-like enzyme
MTEIPKLELTKIFDFLTPTDLPGFILNFSNRTFEEFILFSTKIDIYEKGKYDDYGDSKAKRLHSFFAKESDRIVGKVLLDLVEHRKTLESKQYSPRIKPDEIVEIASKLTEGSLDEDQNATSAAYFKKIREQILIELEKAEFTIWIAVAWFTDPVLFNFLITKKEQGLNIQIVINNDDTNNLSGLDYSQLETYKLTIPRYNRMHHKFCIIDFNTVIHGSYNWTKTARYNSETIDILNGYVKAKEFSQEFMKLKSQGKK